ncbi:MAG: CvpA family protein, partial [Parabacteroides sp.]|nr:CvpA family protein [Parabacteroides sp.]
MWIDIVIALIFVLSTAQGYRKGFIYTFIHTAGWLLAIVLGYVLYPHVSAFLLDKTNFYYGIHEKIADKISDRGSAIIDPVSDNLPTIFGNVVDSAEQAITSALTDGLSDFLFQIISFLAVVIGIRLFFLLLSS